MTDRTAPSAELDDQIYDSSSSDILHSRLLDSRAGCDSNGSACGNTENSPGHPLEWDWIKLAAPLPTHNTGIDLQSHPNVAYPGEGLSGAIREALRPPGIADHSIELICDDGWNALLDSELSDMPDLLDLKLGELSQTWSGEDFDAFAEEVTATVSKARRLLTDIEQGFSELKDAGEAIYAAQGEGGGMLYPAPMVWKAEPGNYGQGSKIHVRPPFTDGDCAKTRDEGEVWRMLGLGTDMDAVHEQNVEARAEVLIQRDAARDVAPNPSSARALAEEEYEAHFDDFSYRKAEEHRLIAAGHNDVLQSAVYNVQDAQSRPALAVATATPSTVADDEALGHDRPSLTSPPPPDPIPSPSMADYNPPESQPTDYGFPSPDTEGTISPPSGSPSGSHGPGSDLTSSDPTGSDPWESATGADGDVGGGLASGGGLGGGAGAGLGAGSGGIGSGAGGAGSGMVAAPGGAGGLRSPASLAANRIAGARGGMPGAPGARGAATNDDAVNGRETWLLEDDEEIWGPKIDEEGDPLA
ncbi:hypothetical protein [Glycomyces tenuis]|uniref:hypothetical protein n=1 Tax=Glycomyces tenuis TaxID=58116 RepID=UPI0004289715|nr:hypothetical protein [Glycomyces tenuis]